MNLSELGKACYETLLMVLISGLLSYLVGLPLGTLLYMSGKKGFKSNRGINVPLGIFINIMRSIPCLLLIIILLPLTRLIFGRGTGAWYTMIIPLFISSFGFVSRMVESSLNEVDEGLIEMARSFGAKNRDIIWHVLYKEAKPSLLLGVALSLISLLGYSAFAYEFGAGGLIALAYSFYATHTGDYLAHMDIYIITLVIVVLVQLIQEGGIYLAKRVDKRKVINQ